VFVVGSRITICNLSNGSFTVTNLFKLTIVVWDPTTNKTEVPTLTWHFLYLLFILYIVPDDGLINPKHVDNAFERENKLCSD